MNVLLAVHADDKRGGVVAVVENVATCLKANGHDVLLFHSDAEPILRDKVSQIGFPSVDLRLTLPFGPGLRGFFRTVTFPFVFPFVLLQLIWFLTTRQIQIVNLHYPIDNFVYFAICRRLLPIRLVTSVHGRDAFYRDKPLASYTRAFKAIVNASDLIVLPSASYRSKFLEAFPGCRDNTIFIHNSVDPAQFSPTSMEDTRATQSSAVTPRYMLSVAEMREDKALDVLLRAVVPLFASDSSLRLVLVGDGPERPQLEALASSLGIAGRVDFRGRQSAAEVIELLRGCALKVLPSRMEPFGIAILEALACRKAVVACAVGGIPEIIQHEQNGILVQPDNPDALTAALRRVLDDGELRDRVADNGYATVMARFCSWHNGAAYENAFRSLLGIQAPGVPIPATKN